MREPQDRICLVTGATQGIGRVAAEALAKQGQRVILVGRNAARTEETAAAIRSAAGHDRVEALVADLSSMAEVRRLAADMRARYDRLDVLVNNAGAVFSARHTTADGLEMTFALNHIAYFVLASELSPLLRASAPARIVNVASGAHFRGTMHFDDLQLERGWRPFRAYCQSKLANILFTRELARRLQGQSVTANCLHPGFVRSGFGRNDGLWMKAGVMLAQLFARTPERGAQTIIHLASSPAVEGVTGRYFFDEREATPSREARDDAVARRLWEETEKIVAALTTRSPAGDAAAPA
jgi:NAD(P)-dependent dehydrogenase (short-subunit alcohol dehydrogenase family)